MKIKDIFNVNDKNAIDYNVSNFLDCFYASTKQEQQDIIMEEPLYNKHTLPEDYAYVAAMAEKLCHDYELEYPDWIFKDEYFLKEPWFPPNVKGKARIYLMLYSPVEFLRRNFFVSENAITRV